MNIDIVSNSDMYSVNLERITQLSGQNIVLKDMVIDIVVKYFSSEKYADWEIVPEIKYHDEVLGRKYFLINYIDNKSSLINQIKNLKTGIVIKLMKVAVDELCYQNSLEKINDELVNIFSNLEDDIFEDIGNISLGFDRDSLLDIIQKSHIETKGGEQLELLGNKELLDIYVNTICKYQEYDPAKRMIVIKNIDHMLNVDEYDRFIATLKNITAITDSWFVLALSLQGYCNVDGTLIEGVNVFNDVIYNMPNLEHIKTFLENNYPYNIEFDEDMLINELRYAVINIGNGKPLQSMDSLAFVKLINASMQIESKMIRPVNKLLSAFLCDK